MSLFILGLRSLKSKAEVEDDMGPCQSSAAPAVQGKLPAEDTVTYMLVPQGSLWDVMENSWYPLEKGDKQSSLFLQVHHEEQWERAQTS